MGKPKRKFVRFVTCNVCKQPKDRKKEIVHRKKDEEKYRCDTCFRKIIKERYGVDV